MDIGEKMTGPNIDKLVIHTQDVLKHFLEKREMLLKFIEKELIKLSKKQCSRIRHLRDGETSLFVELDKILHKLIEFDVDTFFRFICDFENKYEEIYNREVHPDIMKREMIKFLSNSVDDVLAYAKRLDELFVDLSNFYKYLKTISSVKTEFTDAIKNKMDTISICKHQCFENIVCLRDAIKYFNIPTECPPHL